MIDNDALAAILQNEERLAVSFRDSTLAGEQEAAIDYYEARPYGDEEEGRSQVVTPDVAEVVDYMGISVLRTVVAGDRVVEVEANEADQVEAATEATEAVNYIFMRQQDGYKVLSDWLQSGLIEKIGVVKTAVDEDRKVKRERHLVDEDMLAALMESETPPTAVSDNGDGTFLVEIAREYTQKRYIDMPIPSEEFLFSSRCRDVDDPGYKAHRTRKTISELVEMGFDRDVVESLPGDDNSTSVDSRTTARWDDEGVTADSAIPGMRRVWLLEEYVNIDLDDDGIAELVQIFRVDTTILSVDEVDENPFVVWSPYPRAHRMVGNSLAEKVMDIQRIRSVVMRQTLDGVQLTNNPRMWLPDECQNENTIEDLLTVRVGGIVRGRGAGGKPEPLYEPFDVQKGLSMNEVLVGERESRTGITRLNQGLDADALNKTATGTALMQAQGQQMEEFIARNFAAAMGRLYMKKMRLMIASGEEIAIKVEGGFKKVQPGNWSPDMDVSIRVGLGSGRKDQRVAYRMQLAQMQERGMEAGLVEPQHIYNNLSGLIRDTDLGNPTDLWPDPKTLQPKEPQPDPKMLELQQKGQIEGAKLQQKSASDQQALILKAQTEGAKLQQKTQEAVMEGNLEMYRIDKEAQLAEQGAFLKAANDISRNRPGGDLDK